jgi:hypothetical protein
VVSNTFLEINTQENLPENERKKIARNIFIVKPGEMTNRGFGITVESELKDIEAILNRKEIYKNGNFKTYIV